LHPAERSNSFLWAFRQIGFIGTMHQVLSKWPLARPLVFFFLPPKLAVIMPTIYRENNKIVQDRVERRHNLPYPDYLSQLVTKDHVPEHDYIVAQANHLILGGFDPDTNLFTSMIHFLLVNPEKLQRLQGEIRTKFNTYEEITADATQNLPWLKACIEESLRVHTNGAFGLPRVSPGAFVDGHWIPEGVGIPLSRNDVLTRAG
jgi:cytochrome P450